MGGLCRERGVPFVVVIFPLFAQPARRALSLRGAPREGRAGGGGGGGQGRRPASLLPHGSTGGCWSWTARPTSTRTRSPTASPPRPSRGRWTTWCRGLRLPHAPAHEPLAGRGGSSPRSWPSRPGLAVHAMRGNSATFDEGAHLPAGYTHLALGDHRLNPEQPPLVKLLAAAPLLAGRPGAAHHGRLLDAGPPVGVRPALPLPLERRRPAAVPGPPAGGGARLVPGRRRLRRGAPALRPPGRRRRRVPRRALARRAGARRARDHRPRLRALLLSGRDRLRPAAGEGHRREAARGRPRDGRGLRHQVLGADPGARLRPARAACGAGGRACRGAAGPARPAGAAARRGRRARARRRVGRLRLPGGALAGPGRPRRARRAARRGRRGRARPRGRVRRVAPASFPEDYARGLLFVGRALGRAADVPAGRAARLAASRTTSRVTLPAEDAAAAAAAHGHRARARCRGSRRRDAALVWLPVAVYLAATATRGLQIGHRHLLPIYPFLFLAAGEAAAALRSWRAPKGACARGGARASGTRAARCASTRTTSPTSTSSPAGPRNGWRLLVDSNLDWGQDLKRLARVAARRIRTPGLKLSYFGSADPAYYGIVSEALPGYTSPHAPRITREIRPGDVAGGERHEPAGRLPGAGGPRADGARARARARSPGSATRSSSTARTSRGRPPR